jgi:hypothetical protein
MIRPMGWGITIGSRLDGSYCHECDNFKYLCTCNEEKEERKDDNESRD